MRLLVVLILTLSLFSVAACKKEEGPLEKAGKKADQMLEDAGKKLDE